eukprot:990473-Pleurochrysis_carterae.AAC.2
MSRADVCHKLGEAYRRRERAVQCSVIGPSADAACRDARTYAPRAAHCMGGAAAGAAAAARRVQVK